MMHVVAWPGCDVAGGCDEPLCESLRPSDAADDRTFWMVGELQDENGWTTEIHRFTLGLADDLNGDGEVSGADFGLLLAEFGNAGGPADLNRDGLVDGGDAGLMLVDWTD